MGRKPGSKNKQQRLTPVDMEKITERYKAGESTSSIALSFGLNASSVQRKLKAAGVEIRPAGFRKGAEHHAWVGGRHVPGDGYVRVWLTDDDLFYSMAQRHSPHGGYVLEHRLVMARHIGRPLEEHETVHHIDGNKLNNSVENLQLRSGKHGKGVILQCADCGSHNINSRSIH